MTEIKTKTINAFSWSLVEGFMGQGVVFIIGLVLARLLTPEDFGLFGILLVFIALSNSLVEGGLGNALIRKKNLDKNDYDTVFLCNVSVGFLIYLIVYLTSPFISIFFKENSLSLLIKISSLAIIFNSFSIIQKTILVKLLDFKKQAMISVVSSVIAGFIAVFMAYNDYGIWSLVFLTLIRQFLISVFLWVFSGWFPNFIFDKESFRELFGYGYKLVLSSLINSIYQNLYTILIGKFFSSTFLGYYSRADGFQKPISSNLALGIRRISFPVLSEFQDDNNLLKEKFRKFIRLSFFLSSSILVAFAAMARPIILILIGEKWSESIYYTQLLCIPGILYPLQILNLNILNLKGFSNLNLKLEIIKKLILIPLVLLTIGFSIEILIYGLILFSFIEFFINSYYTKKIISYNISSQLKDLIPYILISISYFLLVFTITFFRLNNYEMFTCQLLVSFMFYAFIIKFIRVKELDELVDVFKKHIKK